MTSSRHNVQFGWPYEEGEDVAFKLESLLRKHNISITSGSPLEEHILRVLKLVGAKKAGQADPRDDVRTTYRTLIGVHQLASQILESAKYPSFLALGPHLRLLNQGKALQNISAGGADPATDKLFELLVGAWAIQIGSDITLDPPEGSSGDNPDVLVTILGQRWGIACKYLHKVHPEGIAAHLVKGLDQIEKSQAEIGVVMFNVSGTLPHDGIWPLAPMSDSAELGPVAWPDAGAPFSVLQNALDHINATITQYLPVGHLEGLFKGKKSIPTFLLWGDTVSAVRIDGKPTATRVYIPYYVRISSGPLPVKANRVLKCFSWAAAVGSPQRGPKPC